MDNLTHTLTGLMLSRAGLGKFAPHGTAILLLAANAPDIDVISALSGSVAYLEHHRGWTHSLAAIPLMALLPVLVVRLFARRRFAWKRAFLVSVVGAASHPMLDWTNVYGVRLLLPFSDAWVRADFFHVVELWIWAALLVGVAAPALARLVSMEIGAKPGSGRGTAIAVLGFLLVFGAGKYLLHQRAVAVLDARLYENEVPLRVVAIPSPVNPFRWVGLVEGRTFYKVNPDLHLRRPFDPTAGRTFYKPEPGPEVERARETETFRAFLSFSQFPLWRVTPVAEPEGGRMVEAMDLRFGAPPQPRFVATAILDDSLHIQEASFRFGGVGEYTKRLW